MAKLFYIIGGSGAGKDSLINYIQEHLSDNVPVKYVQRYITRPADAGGENHIAITETEFLEMKLLNCFAMSWFSHNTYYGIETEINDWISEGFSVVMNGSRAYLQEAINKYPNILPILISVDPVILSERLFSRGRESYSEIQQRVAQAIKLDSCINYTRLQIIENNDSLENAGEKLLSLISEKMSDKCA